MKHIIDSEAVEKRKLFEQFAKEHSMSILKVGEAYSNDDTNYAWWIWQKALASSPKADDVVKDAERYRWLREQNAKLDRDTFVVLGHDSTVEETWQKYWVGSDLDQAIDEAMKGK